MSDRPELADHIDTLPGAAAVPRHNGELVFAEPWEARAFGMVVAMYQSGQFEWESFRQRLIAAVAQAEPDDGSAYYRRWYEAFEDLVVGGGFVSEDAIASRMAEIAAADRHEDDDHDHSHDHGHRHGHGH